MQNSQKAADVLPSGTERRTRQLLIPVEMTKRATDEPRRLAHLAGEMRQRALEARLPGYAEIMVAAAEDLERRVRQLKSLSDTGI